MQVNLAPLQLLSSWDLTVGAPSLPLALACRRHHVPLWLAAFSVPLPVYQFPGELLVNWGQHCKFPVSTGNGVVRPATPWLWTSPSSLYLSPRMRRNVP